MTFSSYSLEIIFTECALTQKSLFNLHPHHSTNPSISLQFILSLLRKFNFRWTEFYLYAKEFNNSPQICIHPEWMQENMKNKNLERKEHSRYFQLHTIFLANDNLIFETGIHSSTSPTITQITPNKWIKFFKVHGHYDCIRSTAHAHGNRSITHELKCTHFAKS